MARLHQLLHSSAPLAITAATGMGGIGKTDLAWHYAETHRADYPAGIWWIRTAQLVVKVLEYSLQMGQPAPPEELDEAAKVQWCYQRWLTQFPDGLRLIIWDDVTDAAAFAALRPFLPTDARFRLLMTTRAKLGHPVQRLELGVLKRSAAFRLLRELVADDRRIAAEVKMAQTLCDWVGRLPLGLELIGRYLARHPNLKLATLLDRLNEKRFQARALDQVPSEMPYRDNLAAAFELSWQSLNDEAKQVGALLSLFALAPIPKPLIAACLADWDEEDLEAALDEDLLGCSLLGMLDNGDYLLHALVRKFFAAKLAEAAIAEDLQRSFAQTMTEVAKTIPQTVTLEVIARVKPVIPHLEAATAYSHCLSEKDCIWPYVGAARFYEGQSLWQEAEQGYRSCQTMSTARLGADHPSTATSLNNLAALYKSQGRYAEAEPLFVQALDIYRSQLGQDHPSTASSLNNLAGLYRAQGRYAEAEPLYLQTLAIFLEKLGENHPNTQTVQRNFVYLVQQAIEAGQTGQLSDHPRTQSVLAQLQNPPRA